MLKFQPQIYSMILLMFAAVVYVIVYNRKLKTYNAIDEPKGIILITEMFVDAMDNIVESNLGKKWVKTFGPYVGSLGYIIFIGTIISIIGIPALTLSFSVTLTLSLVTFIMIHIVAIRATKWHYFKRFTEPFAIFLPVNLVAMWAPLISLSVRLFANILAGTIIITMTYSFTAWLSKFIAPFDILKVFIGPFFHAYFDLFIGLIQSVVFISLTVIFISQEQN